MRELGTLPARVALRWPGREAVVLEEATSTSDVAKARSRSGATAGLVVVAVRQTAGRGRMGRTWHSASADGLYMSVVEPAPRGAAAMTRLPLSCAVAVHEALSSFAPGLRVKWPNDVLAADGRKLSGVLCEGLGAQVVLGIGVNVGHAEMPEPLHGVAVSLRMLGAGAPDPADVAMSILESLATWLPRCQTAWDEVRDAWLAATETIGRTVRIGEVAGRAVALDDDGALIVEGERGPRVRVVTGDVE